MIRPTVGRMVWFQPAKPAEQPLRDSPYAAIIVYVWSDTCVNLVYFDANGELGTACSAMLVQEDSDELPKTGYFAQWMPYQRGQAARAEALEQQLEALVPGTTQASPSDAAGAVIPGSERDT